MGEPKVNVERSTPMRGYEVQISYEQCPVISVFVSDMGSVQVMAGMEDVPYSVNEPQHLELGESYHYDPMKVLV